MRFSYLLLASAVSSELWFANLRAALNKRSLLALYLAIFFLINFMSLGIKQFLPLYDRFNCKIALIELFNWPLRNPTFDTSPLQ